VPSRVNSLTHRDEHAEHASRTTERHSYMFEVDGDLRATYLAFGNWIEQVMIANVDAAWAADMHDGNGRKLEDHRKWVLHLVDVDRNGEDVVGMCDA
jgi:hypothetical protein